MVAVLVLLLSSVCGLVRSAPGTFQSIQFLAPAATSFVSRTDHYFGSSAANKLRPGSFTGRRLGIEDYFSVDLTAPFQSHWDQKHDFFGGQATQHFGRHTTPDFSDGLSYPDPFLRTGSEAKGLASYLYSKELFFDDIPHTKGLLNNQRLRRKNHLQPLVLGSMRSSSPWYRFKSGFGKSSFSDNFFDF